MSELYELPRGWDWKNLKDLCIFENGDRGKNYPSKSAFVKEGIAVVSAKDIDGWNVNLQKLNFITQERFDLLGSGKIKKGDILFCLRGSLGKSALVQNLEKGVIASSLVIIRTNNELNSKLLLYYFNGRIAEDFIIKYNNGSAQPNLSAKNLSLFKFPLPPLKEQKRIVCKLDTLFEKIDKAIELHEKNIKEADAFMGSVLNEVFEELEEKYGKKQLKDIVTKDKTSIKRGPFGSALKKSFFVESGYLVYEQYHALNNDFSMKRYFIDEDKFNELKGFEVKAGDIIISCSGVYLGKLAIIPANYSKGIINQALLKLTLDKNIIIDKVFVYFWNNLINKGFFNEVKKGAAIPNMPPVKELKEIDIPIPSINIQQKVVNYLDEISLKIEKTKAIQKEKLQNLKDLKASILDQAFKGQL